MSDFDLISNIYKLISNGVKFNLVDDRVNVLIDETTSDLDKKNNLEFIKENKEFIKSLLQINNGQLNIANQIFKTQYKNPPLSFAQNRLWFIEEYETGSRAYNIPLVYEISEKLDLKILQISIQAIVFRHEILRTLIRKDDQGNAYQHILNLSSALLEFAEHSAHDSTDLESKIIAASNCVYDLSKDLPIKVSFYSLEYGESMKRYITIVIHHIAFDGWSQEIFIRELETLYHHLSEKAVQSLTENLSETCSEILPALTLQYKDFALWQRFYLSDARLEEQLSYWKKKLQDFTELNFAIDFPRPKEIDYRGKDAYFILDSNTANDLRNLSRKLKQSLFSVLLAGYCLLLRAYCNQDDILIGSPVANRHYSGTEGLIGFFVNTLVFRIQINTNETVTDYIKRVGSEVITAQSFQDLPFEKLVEILDLPKDPSRHPIFQVMFSLQNFEEHSTKERQKSLLLPYNTTENTYEVAKFDLSTGLKDSGFEIWGSFNYATSLFKAESILSMVETYQVILKQFAMLSADQKISDIYYLNETRYAQVIKQWNETDFPYSTNTLHSLFEEQVKKTPHNIAVIYEEKSLNYLMLNKNANQLARFLKKHYLIEKDTRIALCLDRSIEMLICILAILKAGGAYLPIDPNTPTERVTYILSDSDAALLLTNDIYKNKFFKESNKLPIPILSIENKDLQRELSLLECFNLCLPISNSSLAYVIYTSGTTGNPKGVMCEHKGVVNRIEWMNRECPLQASDRILQKTPFIFDVSVWELLWANWYGAAIVFAKNDGHKDPNYIIEIILSQKITVIHFVPSMLKAFLETLELKNASFFELNNLRYLFCSGEALQFPEVKRAQRLLPNAGIYNLYGPTEASIDVLFKNCTKSGILPITLGRPISNTTAYVLDKNLKPLPIGAIGELYIGGEGLARGYLNQEHLTHQKFIPNPFQSKVERLIYRNSKLYKTGDLVRWLPVGEVEYLGRIDFQIKLRGFRIEPQEIEQVLACYEGIKQVAVILYQDNEHNRSGHLIGYYVAKKRLEENLILEYLSQKLPDYMLPSQLVFLDSLPLTVSGKLDRRSLPNPNLTYSHKRVVPRNDLELSIQKIWSEVLGVAATEFGIDDSFFKLGGDSISSIQLISRLKNRLGLDASVKDIFMHKSIKKLCDNVFYQATLKDKIAIKSEIGILSGEVPLLPIQKWFFDNNFQVSNHWNQSFIAEVPTLELNRLRESLEILIWHHDALRLLYKHKNCIQYYSTHIEVRSDIFRVIDISRTRDLAHILTELQSDFNLESGPLYRFAYLHGYQDGTARLWFAFHHLIIDTVSWNILLSDLQSIYEGKPLRAKQTSYRQMAIALQNYAIDHEAEKEYWYHIMENYKQNGGTLLTLQNKLNESFHENTHCIEINEEETQALLHECNNVYGTAIMDLMLTALACALSGILETEDLYLVLEGHGREEIDPAIDITRTVGWFTSLYPVMLTVNRTDLAFSIKNVKNQLHKIPNKGIGFGAIHGYNLDSLPRVCFNYLGKIATVEFAGTLEPQNDWKIIQEASGQSISSLNKSFFLLDTTAVVINGKLQFNFRSMLDENFATTLVNSFVKNLRSIIEHTKSLSRCYLTSSDIDFLISQEHLDTLQSQKEIEAIFLANSLQQGFIYHALKQGDVDEAYTMGLSWTYHSSLSPLHLKYSWELVQKKYSALRLRFDWEEDIIQIIDKESGLDWRFMDVSALTEATQEEKLAEIFNSDRKERYDLNRGSLFRIYLIKRNAFCYSCIFSNHHAILDGWSMPILLREVHSVYHDLMQGNTPQLKQQDTYPAIQQFLQVHAKDHAEYWNAIISGIEEESDLKTLLNDTGNQVNLKNYRHIIKPQECDISIRDDLYKNLKLLCRNSSITINAILQYVWHKILHVYCYANQTVIGATVSGRALPVQNIEEAIGLCINTLPIVMEHTSGMILDSIRALSDNIINVNLKSNINLSELQKNGSRLFDTLFVFENYPISSATTGESKNTLSIQFVDAFDKLDYPLAVIAYDLNEEINFKIKYEGALFKQETIERMLRTVTQLLQQIIDNPHRNASELQYVDPIQYEKIVKVWNATTQYYPKEKTIIDLFDFQANETPNNAAVFDSKLNKHYSYAELQQDSILLAAQLIKREFSPHQNTASSGNLAQCKLIGVLSEKGYYQTVALLGILKSGHAYVPINIEWPAQRIDEVLIESGTRYLLISRQQNDRRELRESISSKYTLLVIEDILAFLNSDEPEIIKLLPKIVPKDIAYVIFTSGSTGKPKGVTIDHAGVVNTIYAMNRKFNISQEDKILAISDLSFDLSVYDIFGLLIAGGEVIFPHQEKIRDPIYWQDLIENHQVTLWNTVPQLASLLIDEFEAAKPQKCPLRLFFLSGDWIPLSLPNRIRNCCQASIISLGGATEGSIWSIYHEIHQVQAHWASIPYGIPLPNQQIYILNKDRSLCPIMAVGEIYIAGDGVAVNYWNNEKYTEESFFLHPDLGRIYRTGDIGKWHEEGYVEFLGRVDFQVKVRGYRVELGEIERILLGFPEIKYSLVIAQRASAQDKSESYLLAYYISDKDLNEELIFEYLRKKLPEYMVPVSLIRIESLPLTSNGKLDRAALLRHQANKAKASLCSNAINIVRPKDDLEQLIYQVWADVLDLKINEFSIQSNFFELGGNSILSIRLISKLNRLLNRRINPSILFKHSSVENLTNFLRSGSNSEEFDFKILARKQYTDASSQDTEQHLEIDIDNENAVLSFAQERLWFINQYEGGSNAYNVPIVLELTEDINCDCLKKSLLSIVSRHEILRSTICQDMDGAAFLKTKTIEDVTEIIQDIHLSANELFKNSSIESSTVAKNLNILLEDEISKALGYVFNLEKEIPIRVTILHVQDHEKYLVIVIHHVAFDGWSSGIFMKELLLHYEYYEKQVMGKEAILELPALSIQYRDFALWQRSYLSGERLAKQLSYWKDKLADYNELRLIADNPRPRNIDYRGHDVHFTLDEATSHDLRNLAREFKVSLFSIMLSAYFLLLRAYSGQDDIVVGSPIANRHYTQTEDLIGFFVNTLVLRLSIQSAKSLQEFIKGVGLEVISAQLNQDLPFEKLVDELGLPKDTSKHPVFQVMFAFQNFLSGSDQNYITENLAKIFKPYVKANEINSFAKFELSTFIDDSGSMIRGCFNYAISIFYEETIRSMVNTYILLLQQIASLMIDKTKQKNFKVYNLDYVNQEDFKEIVYCWNKTEIAYPSEKTIHALIEELAIKQPNGIALVYGSKTHTYHELNLLANSLRSYLKNNFQQYAISNSPIAICMDRSSDLIIGLLAILKLGSYYLPIDPKYPEQRISYMLMDSKTNIVLTNRHQTLRLHRLAEGFDPVINIIEMEDFYSFQQQNESKCLNQNSVDSIKSDSLAYIMYTSGTTGTPKGVLIEHQSVVSLAKANYVIVNERDSGMFLSDIAFDASTFEIWGILLNGGRVVIPKDNLDLLSDVNLVEEELHVNKITVLWLTKSLFDQLYLANKNLFKHLKYLIVGGEALNKELISEILRSASKPKFIINGYGPTENTTFSCTHLIQSDDLVKFNSVPIGKPLSNRKAYVLNRDLKVMNVFSVGELYVGGPGLARGYLNQDILTQEKFLSNPYQTEEERKNGQNARLYRTGDVVRWLSGGILEYLGRCDHQVKLRGYRIELNEIENILLSHPLVKHCAVELQFNSNAIKNNTTQNPQTALEDMKYLVAYYVKDDESNQNDKDKFLLKWDDMFQSLYSGRDSEFFDFSGWNSSYTGAAIAREDMFEWQNATLQRIKTLNSKIILEIGSGTGLLALELVKEVEYYYATDISENSIQQLKAKMQQMKQIEKIDFVACRANELPFDRFKKSFNTVILNSVVQYFPNEQYLRDLIQNLISNIADIGKIFLGDIRDFRLLECFYYDTLLYKNKHVRKHEIEYLSKRDKEFLISPLYFYYLKSIYPAITNVEVVPKYGNAMTEMNLYRYDVILTIDKTHSNAASALVHNVNIDDAYIDVEITKFVITEELHSTLPLSENEEQDYLTIKYINRRISKQYFGYQALGKNNAIDTFSNLSSLSIGEIINLAEKKNWSVKIFLDPINPLYLNLIFYKNKTKDIKQFRCLLGESQNLLVADDLCNNPLFASRLLDNDDAFLLKKYLQEKLPHYMVPSYFVLLDDLPRTESGKLNRKKLPQLLMYSNENYVAPRNEMEVALCGMFAEVLGLPYDKVGIQDDFFRMGGNSILSTRIITRINKFYDSSLKISDLFTKPTVQSLLRHLIHKRNKYQAIVKLNNCTNKPSLFMIHPGLGGCEVYMSLANYLKDNYACYGIDSYNLYHREKIEDLNELANFYLSCMEEYPQKEYNILGWSLGGIIALELAVLLEQRGNRKINLYLLDVFLADKRYQELEQEAREHTDNETKLALHKELLISQGYDAKHIEKVLDNIDVENKLSRNTISNKLKYTKIVLYKAMQKDLRLFQNTDLLDKLHLHISKLTFNNIDKIVASSELIHLVKVPDAHHGNILEFETLIAQPLLKSIPHTVEQVAF